MATIEKLILSGSTNGLPTVCTGGTASAQAVPIHTAGSGTSNMDEVWIWATNISSTASVLLTIEFGGAAAAQKIVQLINPSETVAVVPGIPLNNAKAIEAFASVVDVVNVFGFVNRITA
tara:strand:+ start:302 stop:658 length:357 start_codon:yes stop_codon:yes gene_type:complete